MPRGTERNTTNPAQPAPARAGAALSTIAAHRVPDLVSPAGLLELYPAIKARTLRRWIQQAAPNRVRVGGRKRVLPGNGLGPAIIRKGRVTLIDPAKFRGWLYEGQLPE